MHEVTAALARARDEDGLAALGRAIRAIGEADKITAAIVHERAELERIRREHRRAKRAARLQPELPFGYGHLAF